jgi:formylmethanofuran dehydrogenase subunit B
MAEAWIRGDPATFEAATEEAARLIGASRMPIFAGLGADVAGARAAIRLAQRLGGAIDHMHADALLRDLDAMRAGGMMTTTPNEARLRADLLLLVGRGLTAAWPDLPQRLLAPRQDARRVVWLCGGAEADAHAGSITRIGDAEEDLPVLLATVRALCGGRPAGDVAAPVAALAADLARAKFGVAVWSAATLDALTIEMLCGLVNDLNAATRFSGLPLAAADNAAAVLDVSGWLTGFPPRCGFARGAEHDSWRFDAVRLVDSGEADCAIWISALGAARPTWTRDVPTILLACDEALAGKTAVAIKVGRPGIDHDAVLHLPATGTLAPQFARQGAQAVSVAQVLDAVAARLPEDAS